MTLLNAFAESRNIPALKLAARYGIRKVIETAHRFGITSEIPAFLPVAIGSADITLAEQVGAYSVFPNDGIRIEPRYIRKVTQSNGLPFEMTSSDVTEVISVETARTMMQLLQAVVRQGTGVAASQMKHPFGGKTGTTNDFTDAWFIGFSPSVTCGTWIGFDDRQTLGEKETGARAALPMWMDFMRAAIANKPNEAFPTAGAPKKTLDVSVNGVADAVKPARPPVAKPDEEDPDAPAGSAPKAVAPVAAPAPAPSASTTTPTPSVTPAAPVDRPKASEAPRRVAPVNAAPASPAPASPPPATTAPAKSPADPRSGVSSPPPDID
jgi:penicillin-binding protein 1A